MNLLPSFKLSSINIHNLLLAFIPISFIAGNLLININIILIIIVALSFYKKEIFTQKLYFLDKLIISFFFLILFTGIFNDLNFFITELYSNGINTIIKSILFLKYLILYFVIRFLVEKNKIDLKYFFLSCTIFTLFVSFDLFYQFLTGADIFGYKVIETGRKLSGPFGDEYIAGSYLQRFSVFSFFIFSLFYKNKYKNLEKFLVPFFFVIFLLAILISGNRMPLILFIFLICVIIVFQKSTKKYFLPFVIASSIIFYIVISVNSEVKTNFKNFYLQLSQMSSLVLDNTLGDESVPEYFKQFSTFYDTWLMNKYIGGGIKNFRYYCHERPNIDPNSKLVCNMHPHNYYLEVLTETGLVGFVIIIFIFANTLYISFFKKYFFSSPLKDNKIMVPFLFLFITEIFPIKSSGSFFTTGNTTFLILVMGILIAICRKENLIENKF